MKRVLLLLLIIAILVIPTSFFSLINDQLKHQKITVTKPHILKKSGYNAAEIKIIDEYLNDNDIQAVSELPYNKNLGSYVTVNNFCLNKLDRYDAYLALTAKEPLLIVSEVTMNIDQPFYTNIQTIPSLNKETLINKYYQLSSNINPALTKVSTKYTNRDVDANVEAYEYLVQMFDASINAGMNIRISSGYRSAAKQTDLYNSYVKDKGVIAADLGSARPGHSEHQSGYAFDLKEVNSSYEDFGKKAEYTWMQNNAYKYGFIIRYPENKTYITGYKFEPWHIRYIGIDIASVIQKEQITLEEYYAKYKKIEC